MKITKSQLRKLIAETLAEGEVKYGGMTVRYSQDPDKVAFEKLKNSMELIEQAMLYMYSEGQEGQSPTAVIEEVREILSKGK